MSVFEMVFNLVGLVLGFALVEVLSGLSRMLRLRGKARMGWLTPLLGIWVLADVATFWGIAWNFRDLMTEWRTAGRGRRSVDDALWKRFQAAQDAFFEARRSASEHCRPRPSQSMSGPSPPSRRR